ncbi:Protein of unknown function DUF179 [Cynara cardunculus var. scolymus]|uniref:Uncharacterized protein n=1 Tax=Cynara cardunculus var. scolymus TaxID=59895 RepID=A0A103XWP9_CYNCS|nr:Protein of unknown function DUF179 [Cynara cardunculus var. scolymus]
MDLWAVQIKTAARCPYVSKNNHLYDKPVSSWKSRKMVSFDVGKAFEIRVPRGTVSSRTSFVVRAMGKKNSQNNSDSSSPSGVAWFEWGVKGMLFACSQLWRLACNTIVGEGHNGNNPAESNKSSNTGTPKSQNKATDWREFRAILYLNQQLMLNKQEEGVVQESKRLGSKWAHPLTSPETGCVLVATEKLDGVQTFERSVVFLLGSGTRHPQEGPFGVIVNRPLHKKIKNMKPTNLHLATTFSDCLLHFGGPLEASIFLLRAGGKKNILDFEEVIPTLCFGSRNSLDEASALVKTGVLKPQDFRFFVGYAGWQLDQLREEIDAGLWHVAACSSNLIFGGTQNSSTEGLWEEILQLMGGRYSELSRKPKQDL